MAWPAFLFSRGDGYLGNEMYDAISAHIILVGGLYKWNGNECG